MSRDDAAPRPKRALTLRPTLPNPNPATVAAMDPEDGPLIWDILFTDGFRNENVLEFLALNPQKSP